MWYLATDFWLPDEAIATVLQNSRITLVDEWLSKPRTSNSMIRKAANLMKHHMSRKSSEMCGKHIGKFFY